MEKKRKKAGRLKNGGLERGVRYWSYFAAIAGAVATSLVVYVN